MVQIIWESKLRIKIKYRDYLHLKWIEKERRVFKIIRINNGKIMQIVKKTICLQKGKCRTITMFRIKFHLIF